MSKLSKLLVVAALAAATLALAGPASAQHVSAACEEDGHVFTGDAFFANDGVHHLWYAYEYELGNTGDQSNVNIRLRENGTLRFAWNSPDNREEGVRYPLDVVPATRLLRANTEIASFEVIFDEFGPDDRCTAFAVDPQ